MEHKHRNQEEISGTSWMGKPQEGMIKINIDGLLRNNRGNWGAALRMHDGNVCRVAHGA